VIGRGRDRLTLLFGTFVCLLALVVGRLVFLQVRDAAAYQDLAAEQRVRTVPLPAARGAIVDRNFRDLALSLEARAVYADQRYVRDPEAAAAQIAEILEMKPVDVARRLRGESSFVYVARHVDRDRADRIAALNIPGIGFLPESRRYYPAGELGAPHVLGFVGTDGTGLGGLEYHYEETLAGAPGERREEIDPAGNPIPQGVQITRPPEPGRDVVTTIDTQLQYRVQLALEDAVRREDAKGGTVIVMHARTGEIYAMASYPWFDPVDAPQVAARKPELLRNPAVQDVYEPGSVNKVITAAAAVEEQAVDLRDKFLVPDRLQRYDEVIHDAHPHPTEKMMIGDIITQSSNVGTILVAEELGDDLLATYLATFGFGRETGVGFPGESPGLLPPQYEWSGTSMATLPIGQGVSVTPLQMTSVYGTIANGGEWVQPRLVRGWRDADGAFHPAPEPERRRVVSRKTATIVTGMLAQVVASEHGTGSEAQIPGYWVAGKTGTAQKPKENGRGYTRRFVASFIGFLPASDPEIVVAAILDEPASKYGGLAAAPLFRRVSLDAIQRLRIPPGTEPKPPPMLFR
jgi:cell division protein FtsI (penicillin-binding protein 3)